MLMGHENTGEVVEVGSHVQSSRRAISAQSLERCLRNLHQLQATPYQVCLRSNEELGHCGAYGLNLGGWPGGQADEYMLVPWADFQLLSWVTLGRRGR
jgi:glutathione-independent formaldehyde dehydrogenase